LLEPALRALLLAQPVRWARSMVSASLTRPLGADR
jgi:hypothetical protein